MPSMRREVSGESVVAGGEVGGEERVIMKDLGRGSG
jgi:hypothetical protein